MNRCVRLFDFLLYRLDQRTTNDANGRCPIFRSSFTYAIYALEVALLLLFLFRRTQDGDEFFYRFAIQANSRLYGVQYSYDLFATPLAPLTTKDRNGRESLQDITTGHRRLTWLQELPAESLNHHPY